MEKKKKKGLKTAILAILVVILAAGVGAAYYLYTQVNSGLFFKETKINGYDVSEKTCKEVLLMLEKDYSAPKITVTEGGETAETLTLADMGYTINEKKLLSAIQDCMRQQNVSLLLSLMDGNTFEVDVPFDYDEDIFKSNVCAAKFAKTRVASVDATMEYDGKEYYIKPETYGTEFDDADLQVMIKDTADKLVAASRPQKDVTVDFPSGLYYVPAVTQNDSEMNTTMNIYNSFCKADIKLMFGDEYEEINWSTIKDWLTIEDGEMVAIIGTSGAGKSTLLHILACIDGYDSGEYRIDDMTIGKISERKMAAIRNEKIGMVMQDFALIEEFTALDNVMIPLDFAARGKKKRKKDRKEIARKMLEMVQMQDFVDKPVSNLSGGQKQRVAIARAIANEPALILADEPTGALDTETTKEIMKVFIDLNKQGKTIVIVTHDLAVAEQCGRVIKIEDGKMIE